MLFRVYAGIISNIGVGVRRFFGFVLGGAVGQGVVGSCFDVCMGEGSQIFFFAG